MYVETIYRMGDVIEVKRRSGLYMGAPGRARAKKSKATKDEVKKQNEKNRGRHLQRLLLANFKAGDLHIVLQYRKEDRPEEYADALKRIRLFIRRIKKYYQDRGHRLKYIAVTERGKKRSVLHHHIVLQGIDENGLNTLPAVTKCWDGYVKASVMYEDGEFAQLADYLIKAAGKEEKQGATYIRSRNLTDPEPEKVLKFGRIKDDAPDGYEIIKDSAEEIKNRYGTYKRFLARKVKKISKSCNKTVPKVQKSPVKTILGNIKSIKDKIKGKHESTHNNGNHAKRPRQ